MTITFLRSDHSLQTLMVSDDLQYVIESIEHEHILMLRRIGHKEITKQSKIIRFLFPLIT